MSFKLTNPPHDKRNRELWLQHSAGFIIFQDMRNAIGRIPSDTNEETKELSIDSSVGSISKRNTPIFS